MDDSFFGFETSIPVEDDGGGGLEDNESDYDALNDETFGKAINGDWEDIHESYVRLDRNSDLKDDDEDAEADLELNLSRVSIDDFDVADEDNEARIQLDPSVWANPFKLPSQNNSTTELYGIYRNQDALLRQNISNSMSMLPGPTPPIQQFQQPNNIIHPAGIPTTIPPPKMMTVEDIERNIRNQQKHNQAPQKPPQQTTQQPQPQLQQQQPPIDMVNRSQTPQIPRNVQNNQILLQPFPRGNPPGIPPMKGSMFPPHQVPPGQPKPMPRLPPGFPPMPIMGPPPGPHHLPGPLGTAMPPPRPMPHNLPVALNNFAMHPNFNAIRQNIVPPRLPPHMQPPHFPLNNIQSVQNNINQFNQRLVQEIQQNHPMLPFNRINNMYNNNIGPQHHMNMNMNMNMQQQMHNALQQNNKQQQQHHHHHQQQMRNGNLNEEYDEYSNLMSNRDKQWLISIQLSQLNTDTPYIDDYYYTVFKERKAKIKGQSESKAHKDNQLNHPFSQPRGHAHLVLISMNNKNGNNHQRNGQNIRERRTSESNKDKEQSPRTYTPLQFENSLGKLQCGSVTAPRKIIDMDVVGADAANPFNASLELSTQRKSRQLLLHIETLYRIVLKMEDFENPTAIATSLIVKERKEKERQNLLEQQALLDNLESKDNEGNLNLDSIGNSLRSSIALSEKEEEGYDDLLPKLVAGLTSEKVAQMMTVRKGRTLLKRAIPLIKDHTVKWELWYAIFTVLPIIVKKDRDDAEGTLFGMFPDFKSQIQESKMTEIIKLGNCLTLSEKKIISVLQSKFCISCIFMLILRAEFIYSNEPDTINTDVETAWLAFLTSLVNALSSNVNAITAHEQTLDTSIENDVIKPLRSHFARFDELKSQQLLAVLTQDTV